MQPGRASRTAELVCMARAAAHGRVAVGRYADPTAHVLLPEGAWRRIDRTLGGRGLARAFLLGRASMMVARTVAIDDAIREAPAPQIVILGAGLDGRAWRMTELSDSIVFEVDHPDTQRDKRARLGPLVQAAREVRFVTVDFEREDLDLKLAEAGHDPALPTTWIWEGVVMYLERRDIEQTLRVVERRSARKSRLVITYHTPGLMSFLIGLAVARVGEPFRSMFTTAQMGRLLRERGYEALRDESLPEIGRALGYEVARDTRRLTHSRVVVAERG